MGTLHGHGHDHGQEVSAKSGVTRIIWRVVVLCGVATVAALALLWPSDSTGYGDPLLLDADPINAEVVAVDEVLCSTASSESCRVVEFVLSDGAAKGQSGSIEESSQGNLAVGDKIKVVFFEDLSGNRIYSFYDYQRAVPMIVLTMLFIVAVLALGGWRGLGALAGLAVSLLVIVGFALPAILEGSNPVTVAVVAASAIAFVALFLAHGFHATTAVALIATLTSLLLTAALAWIFVAASRLTGYSDDASYLLSGLATDIDPRGILLAGIVIGSLGVLDDVTVTQVSAVWQLKAAQPGMRTVELVRSAMRIGRDHISSTVNTLFLAYAGTALPLLLLFVFANQGFSNVITREVVGTEVIRTLVGSIGLVASVPIATWLAAIVISEVRSPSDSALTPQADSYGASGSEI